MLFFPFSHTVRTSTRTSGLMKYKQCHLLPSINRRVTPQGLRAQTICGSERLFAHAAAATTTSAAHSGILISAHQRRPDGLSASNTHTKFSFLSQFFWGHLLSLPMRAARRRRKKRRAHFFISFGRTACKHGLKRKTSALEKYTRGLKSIRTRFCCCLPIDWPRW